MSPTGGDSPGDSEYSSTKSPRQNTPRQKSPHQKSPNQPKNPLHISSQIQRFGHLFLLLSLNFIQSVSSTSSRSANSRDVILEFTDEQLKNEIFRLENTNDQPEKSITSTTASKKTSFNNLVSRDIIAPFFHNASITHDLQYISRINAHTFHFKQNVSKRLRRSVITRQSKQQFPQSSSSNLLESNEHFFLEIPQVKSRQYRNRNQHILFKPLEKQRSSHILKKRQIDETQIEDTQISVQNQQISENSRKIRDSRDPYARIQAAKLKAQQAIAAAAGASSTSESALSSDFLAKINPNSALQSYSKNIPISKFALYKKKPLDPDWEKMWYLNRFDFDSGRHHLNVTAAWAMGYTGKGVVVTILDDGIERDHPDLLTNYDSQASYDFNSNDDDPMPRYNPQNENRHGTRCAGEVAAVRDNNVCVPGIAYDASIGGIRMLDGDVTDVVECKSVSHNPQSVDVYSSSWGPDDDGKTVDGPGRLTKQAFIDGAKNGRNGKGSIFVWASGNGGRYHDSCSCDGYCNSIYTITVSSTTENENIPWYSEKCASTLSATYSSGTRPERNIVTTDLRHGCTPSHTGTSASAPIAAAMVALALEANPTLTWRDMQHLIVRSSNPQVLEKSGSFAVNGAGWKVSHSYGFGLMDAGRMCELAKNWEPVGPLKRIGVKLFEGGLAFTGKEVLKDYTVDPVINGVSLNKIKLETVTAVVTLEFPYRGMLEIYLTSPEGTTSQMLFKRQNDRSPHGFKMWEFMSVLHWDEKAAGVWKLRIANGGSILTQKGVLKYFELIFTGTTPENDESEVVTEVIKKSARSGDSEEEEIGLNVEVQGDGNPEINMEEKNMENDQTVVETKENDDNQDPSVTEVPENRNPESSIPKTEVPPTETISLLEHCIKGSEITCEECKKGTFLHLGTCNSECPDKFAKQPLPKPHCESCHPTCATCLGSLATECKSCLDGWLITTVNSCKQITLTPHSEVTVDKTEKMATEVSKIEEKLVEKVVEQVTEKRVLSEEAQDLKPEDLDPTIVSDYNKESSTAEFQSLHDRLTEQLKVASEDSIQNILYQGIIFVFLLVVLLLILSKLGCFGRANKKVGYQRVNSSSEMT